MEYNYKGIKPENIELLCLNRFNDSKPFYEEHKEELKQGITVPLRQMVLDMSDVLFDIDDKMYLDPVRVHSRIHRDTRGNRSKIKYRENMWVFFRRYKKEYPSAPFFYFLRDWEKLRYHKPVFPSLSSSRRNILPAPSSL